MYVLFGAGIIGQKVLNLIGQDNVAYFIDNDESKWGTRIGGKSVFSLNKKREELLLNYKVIITTQKKYESEIVKQLKQAGISESLSINERLYDTKEAFIEAKRNLEILGNNDVKLFWNEQNAFSTKDVYPNQFANEKKLIFHEFLPRLNDAPYIADIGCAHGFWSNEVSTACKQGDGFDYSSSMIENAKRNYTKENVTFTCCDIRNYKFEYSYDGIMLMSILMYMMDEDKVFEMIEKVKSCLKPGGILLTKETLNVTADNSLYLYNPLRNYSAFYMTQNTYYSLFYKAGFILVNDLLLDVRKEDESGHGFISRGTLWKLR